MKRSMRWIAGGVGASVLVLSLLAGVSARADNDSCQEWRGEHRAWKTEGLRRVLHGAPQRELDEAIFELLQREAYLTSCDSPVESSRRSMVGWRLVGRVPDEYGSVVVEALLDNAGFDVGLRDQLTVHDTAVASRSPRGARFLPRWLRNGSR